MIEGQGFRFDPAALVAFAESTSRMVGLVTEARSGLDAGRDLTAGVFGEVGETSGFLAAFAERSTRMLAAVDSVGRGIDGLAAAVRAYCDQKQGLDEEAALGLRRAESV